MRRSQAGLFHRAFPSGCPTLKGGVSFKSVCATKFAPQDFFINPSSVGFDHRRHSGECRNPEPKSRAEGNGDAPVFHPPLIGGNTEEIKKQRQGEMSRVGHFWIPSNPSSSVGSDTGMTSKGEGQSQAKRAFSTPPHWSRLTFDTALTRLLRMRVWGACSG